MARALALALCVCLSACAGAQHPKREKAAELRVVAVPEGALVEVNERSVGSARVLAQRPVRLKPGKKRITITAPGHFPHDLEVELRPGETKIDIKLRAVPK
jgi:hypothetical protein